MTPESVGNFEKRAINLRILGRVATLWAKHLLAPSAKDPSLPNDLASSARAQAAVNRIIEQKKYKRFNGRTFVDLYMPPFPSPNFDEMIKSTVLNLAPRKGVPYRFIPNVDIGITAKCMFRCEHCYAADALDKHDQVSVDQWKAVIDSFLDIGVGALSFVGGEPLLRFADMVALCEYARGRTDVWTVTAGWGLTKEKADRLAAAGLIGATVSLDHFDPDRHNAFRRNPKAFDAAVKAVRTFAEAGIYPALAICSTRDVLQNDGLDTFLKLAKDLGVGHVQIVEPIRSGNYIDRDDSVSLTNEELKSVQAFQLKVNRDPAYAEFPSITSRTSLEDSDIGVGCGAGGNTFIYVDPAGQLQPCPLMNVSTGNVVVEGFNAPMQRMRALFPRTAAIGASCPANLLHDRIADARERIGKLPLPYEEAKEICEEFKDAPLPPAYGGRLGEYFIPSQEPSGAPKRRLPLA